MKKTPISCTQPQVHLISGYKFIALHSLELDELQKLFFKQCSELMLKGTILLSTEGININVCGAAASIGLFKHHLKNDRRFTDIPLQESNAPTETFRRLKVKIRNEIITFGKPNMATINRRAKQIAPTLLKQWLDEKRDFILLDTRNQFEVHHGTFANAMHFNLKHFGEFPHAVDKSNLEKNKTVVMFCTGGIRCEKAALYMQEVGHQDVYQLQGGILNYFATVGRTHYQGDCFVFDERITI